MAAVKPTEQTDANAVAHALAAPFDPSEVKFKPATISGNRALAIPFVDARVIQDRLDEVLGVLNWCDDYECLPDGAVVCRLKVRIGGEWITKVDVGGQSEQPDEGDRRKAAFSDALKRAAVKLGIGRYLYRQKPQWVDYDPQKRQFVRQPMLPGTPAAKAIAKPASPAKEEKPAPAPAPAPAAPPALGNRTMQDAIDYEARLVKAGICEKEELIVALEEALGNAWMMQPREMIEAFCKDKAKQWRAAMAQSA